MWYVVFPRAVAVTVVVQYRNWRVCLSCLVVSSPHASLRKQIGAVMESMTL